MADLTPPIVQNILPLNGSTTVVVSDPISFDIVDDPAGPASSAVIELADNFPSEDLSGQVTGATAAFVTSDAFVPGSLVAWLNGERLVVTEDDPSAGTFHLDDIVAADPGVWLQVDYIKNYVVTAARFSTIVVRLNGGIIFSNGTFAGGYAGVLTAILGGYTILISTHPDFPSGALQVVDVDGTDIAGNPMPTFEWSFSVGIAAVTALPAEVQDDGGYPLLITGAFSPGQPCTVVVKVGGKEYPCYSGTSGQAYAPVPISPTQLRAVSPVLPPGGPYDVIVRQTSSSTIAAALTVRARNWPLRMFALRRAFPPWYKTGSRTLDTTGLLS